MKSANSENNPNATGSLETAFNSIPSGIDPDSDFETASRFVSASDGKILTRTTSLDNSN
jgi:hypothetical protein